MSSCSRRSSASDRGPAGASPIRGSAFRGAAGALVALAVLAAASLAAAPSLAAGQQPPAPPGPGSPAWYESYRKAVADAELENWESVTRRIQQSVAGNPKSERNVRTYGMWHALYTPYYYLGMAQYHLGRNDEALRNLEKEEAAGVIQHDPVAYLKLRRMAAAMRSGAKAPTPLPPAPVEAKAAAAAAGGDNLVEGLQAFFQGDYAKSITAFQEEMKRAPKDDLTLHLYLGMAYAGKASEDAAQKALWRNLAVLEFQRVNAIDSGYALAPGVFSEEMVQLFEEAKRK